MAAIAAGVGAMLCISSSVAAMMMGGDDDKKKKAAAAAAAKKKKDDDDDSDDDSDDDADADADAEDVGGVTNVQLCSPWKARDCNRAGAVMTCPEFKACWQSNKQAPCKGEAWFKKCGW